MVNAKLELIEFSAEVTEKSSGVKCASIYLGDLMENPIKEFDLKVGFTIDEFSEFLNSLDFEYDNGYGSQELFGFIWLKDGSWCERYEYDGSESWAHKSPPIIPEKLIKLKS